MVAVGRRLLIVVGSAVLLAAMGTPAEPGTAWPGGAVGDGSDGSRQMAQCENHPPIFIEEEVGAAGFVLGHHPANGSPIYRPGSGVIGGLGTADEPFLIDGWCIEDGLPVRAPVGILLRGTSSHAVIQGNVFQDQDTAISLVDAANVSIRANLFDSNRRGVDAQGGEAIDIRNNRFLQHHTAIWTSGAERVEIAANSIEQAVEGIQMRETAHSSIIDNRIIDSASRGIGLSATYDETEIRDNKIGGRVGQSGVLFGIGIATEDTHGIHITGNVVENVSLGVSAFMTRAMHITDQSFKSVDHDIVLAHSQAARLARNQMNTGIDLSGTVLEHFLHEIPGSNVVDDLPVLYVHGIPDQSLHGQWGQIVLVETTNRSVEGQGGIRITLAYSNGSRVQDNGDATEGTTIHLYHTEDTTVVNNTVALLYAHSARDAHVHHNVWRGGLGAVVGGSERMTFHHNEFYDYQHQALASIASTVLFHDNNLLNPGPEGIHALASDIDASGNWWGCPEGPDDPGCSGVSGETIRYDPWRVAPVPEAGRFK